MVGKMPQLSPKQKRALKKAPPERRAALRATYLGQRAPAHISKPTRAPHGPGNVDRPFKQPHRAPRGLVRRNNLLDPMNPVPMPAAYSEGRALPHTGLVSTDFATTSGTELGENFTTVVIATNTGKAGTVGMVVKLDHNHTPVHTEVLTIPTLSLADDAGGPTGLRCMKFSASLKNASSNFSRSGRVTYINSSQRLPPIGAGPTGQYTEFINAIKSSPYRRRLTAQDFTGDTCLIGYPTSQTNYTTFGTNHGTLSEAAFLKYCCAPAAGQNMNSRAMSTVCYIIEPVTNPQDYSVTIRASFYTRWALTTVTGQSMHMVPTASQTEINKIRDAAEEAAHELAPVIEGGALVAAAPTVFNAIKMGARAAMARLSQPAVVEGLEMAAPLLGAPVGL